MIKVATLFLILASETTMAKLELNDTLRMISSSLQKCMALDPLSLWFVWWKENLLENKLTNLDLGENSQLRELNKGKILLRWLLVSTIELLIRSLCLEVIFSKERWWYLESEVCLLSRRDLIAWLVKRVEVLS